MEIASDEQSAEALRDALLAEAGRVQQLCGSPCAPGGTVPGDAERLGRRARRYARSYAEEQAKLYDTFLGNLKEGNNEMEE